MASIAEAMLPIGRKGILGCLLCGAFVLCFLLGDTFGASQEEPLSLYIIGRDTLQTRNFVPIVNHQTVIINLGEKPVELELTSKIPAGKHREGEGYPAFLENSLLPDPVFSPIGVSPKKTSYLARPNLVTQKGEMAYVWKGVTLPTGESVIAQYDNYFGEPHYYGRPYGFDFHGIQVKKTYASRRSGKSMWELSFSYDIVNTKAYSIKDFSLSIFVPIKQIRKESETAFLELQQICSSPNIEVSQVTKSDGYGEAGYGVATALMVNDFAPNTKAKFSLRLIGNKIANNGTIWPILNMMGRSQDQAVWPPTIVKVSAPVKQERFSYLSYNLAIKDNHTFVFSPKEISVNPAK